MAAQRLSFVAMYARLRAVMPGAQGRALAAAMDLQKQDVDAIATWATSITTSVNTLATALNTLATKLNADAGVTDTNYAVNNATNATGPGV